ncbi:hypothetical protein B0A55_09192 [Friedmanniomyces simplex]|uniref:Uncharacterized protein n=1 Tax=Friedmanniomyces simplex TaxID=329884 RepID=A0A4U0WYA8_9PEZI|nr:hypothetical protein B0A55_09192 [Friedmanniomyces simplex]
MSRYTDAAASCPADIELVNDSVDATSSKPVARHAANGGDLKVSEGTEVVQDNGIGPAAEPAEGVDLNSGVDDTSSSVSTTPAPKARAGERPSPGWRVGKDPWLSPGTEEDGEEHGGEAVMASILVRASTAVFDGRVEAEQEKGNEDEEVPLRREDETVAAGHEGSTAEHAGEMAQGVDVIAPDREASAVAPDEQQCIAADEQTPSPPQVDRRGDEVKTPDQHRPAVPTEQELPAQYKPTASNAQVDEPSAPDQNEATALPDLPPLARGEQSRLDQKITDGALHSPQRDPAEDHAQEDGSEWEDLSHSAPIAPTASAPKARAAHRRRHTRGTVRIAGRRAAAAAAAQMRPQQSARKQARNHHQGEEMRAYAADFVAMVCWLVGLGVVYALCWESGNG